MKRLLVAGTIGYTIAALICIECKSQISFLCFAILSAFLIISTVVTALHKKFFFPVSVILAFVVLSFLLSMFVHSTRVDKARSFDGYEGEITGQITELYTNKFYSELKINNIKIGAEKLNTHILVSLSQGALDYKEGDYVTLVGSLNRKFISFFGTTDEKYLASQNVFLLMDAHSIEKAGIRPNRFRNLTYDYRQRLTSETSILKHGGFVTALALGDKSNLDIEVADDFQKLGLQHVLAVSGMHLSLLVMTLYTFLKKRTLGKYPLSVICSLITVFYMGLTGFSFSIIRAGTMMVIYFIAILIRRPNDSITTLFTSALFIMILNPWSVFDIGFQLSFFATLGILVFGKPLIERIEEHNFFSNPLPESRLKKFITSTIRAIIKYFPVTFGLSISATLTTLPFILIHFNSITPVSVIANIFVIFLINVVLRGAVVYMILSPLLIPPLKMLMKFICDTLCNTVLSFTGFLADILPDPIYLSPETSNTVAIICLFVLSFFFLFHKNHKTILYVTLTFIIAITVTISGVRLANKNTSYITFSTSPTCLDTLVEATSGKTLLSVVSKNGSKSAAYGIINNRNAYSIDNVVLFLDDASPYEKLEILLEISKFEKLMLVQINGSLSSKEKEKIDKICDAEIEYIKAREFDIDNINIKRFGKKYISATITQGENDTVIVYSLDGKSGPPRAQLENVEGIVLLGNSETCPRYEEKVFYLCSLSEKLIRRKGTSNKGKFDFGFIKISNKKINYNVY